MKFNSDMEDQILNTPGVVVNGVTYPDGYKPPEPGEKRKSPKVAQPDPTPPVLLPAVVQSLWIPGWRPWGLNSIIGHWAKNCSRKKRDRAIVGTAAKLAGMTYATRKRRLTLCVALSRGQKRLDEDNAWKSLKDALVHARLLVNDSPNWLVTDPPRYWRCVEDAPSGTLIVLQDL